jgi:tellurite resistance protein TehA-like permease
MVIRKVIERGVRDLSPGYFALVMATGIVSIAAHLHGMATVAWWLFQINKAAYLILCLMILARLRYWYRIKADASDHSRGAGFLTLVAGTCVLGSQFVLVTGQTGVGFCFWIAGGLLWLALMYGFLTAVMTRNTKPDLRSGITGDWLLLVVATQSVSVLGTLTASLIPAGRESILLAALSMFLLGCALYLLVITLVFYRLTFFPLGAEEFSAAYWIVMGAAAITTLAGAVLILGASQWSLLRETLPFLKGAVLVFWVTGTWWIPLLVILEVRKQLNAQQRLRYDPKYWACVFPLGMYATCTYQAAAVTGIGLMMAISQVFVYMALAAWIITSSGLVWRLASLIARPGASSPSRDRSG